jgi:multisubunit Na+/H+ antiporter MnhE subunit
LASYSTGQTKASVGGFLLGFGTGFIITDLVTAASQDKVYPSALTYIGLASALVSIPIIIGHTKKIKTAINGYNTSITDKKVGFQIEKINILSNKNGIGMQLSF